MAPRAAVPQCLAPRPLQPASRLKQGPRGCPRLGRALTARQPWSRAGLQPAGGGHSRGCCGRPRQSSALLAQQRWSPVGRRPRRAGRRGRAGRVRRGNAGGRGATTWGCSCKARAAPWTCDRAPVLAGLCGCLYVRLLHALAQASWFGQGLECCAGWSWRRVAGGGRG
jgi:hypothetical protein